MRVVTLVRRHPFVAYAVLACLFGWSIYVAAWFGLGSEPDNLPLGPLAAAALVATLQGPPAVRAWWRRLRSWAMSPWLYVLAALAPIALHLLDVGINAAFGAPLPSAEQWSTWPQLLPTAAVVLLMIGIGEEAGWTAFAAPLLRSRHGLLASWALLSAVRILWHLPLVLSGEMPWVVWLLGNAGFQLLLLVVLELPGGRWPFAAVWHTSLNVFGGAFVFTFVTGVDRDRLDLLLGLTYGVVGLVAYALHRQLGRRPARRNPVGGSLWADSAAAARVGVLTGTGAGPCVRASSKSADQEVSARS